MVERSFSFLPGIGTLTERRLWADGIVDWRAFLDAGAIPRIGPTRRQQYSDLVLQAHHHFAQDDARYFSTAFPGPLQWRLYEWLRSRAGFLDIETNSFGHITVVGLYGHGRYEAFVRGDNLHPVALSEALAGVDLLVTFNGTSFDLPMLLATFPGLPLDHPHIDLYCVGRRLGYRGGLKAIEVELGIEREPSLQGVDGSHAIIWWNRWRHRRDREALQLLLAYNEADCTNLKPIADRFYCALAEQAMRQLERGPRIQAR